MGGSKERPLEGVREIWGGYKETLELGRFLPQRGVRSGAEADQRPGNIIPRIEVLTAR